MAAPVATTTVIKLAKSDAADLVPDLERMRDDAAGTERRCSELLSTFEGKKTAILEEARDQEQGRGYVEDLPRRGLRCA
jgi:hypothetical protein